MRTQTSFGGHYCAHHTHEIQTCWSHTPASHSPSWSSTMSSSTAKAMRTLKVGKPSEVALVARLSQGNPGKSGKMKELVSALKELKKAFYFLIIYCKLILNSLVLRECRAEEWVRTSVETRRPNYQASIPLWGHRRVPWWLWEAMPISISTSDILWHYE